MNLIELKRIGSPTLRDWIKERMLKDVISMLVGAKEVGQTMEGPVLSLNL
jgi:hypothetical protein